MVSRLCFSSAKWALKLTTNSSCNSSSIKCSRILWNSILLQKHGINQQILSRSCHSIHNPHPREYAADPELYEKVHHQSLHNPNEFWAEQAEQLSWHTKWDKVLDNSNEPFTRWFVGGKLNMCYNALDKHVEAGFGDQLAVIHDSPLTNSITKITYSQLLKEVSLFADVLRKHGVGPGDRVLIYLPMIPQAMVAMLASARIGAIHSLVFGGFASKELSTRINHAEPKVIVSTNYGVEPKRVVEYKPMLDHAIELSGHKPKSVIMFKRKHDFDVSVPKMIPGRDVDYDEELSKASPTDCVPMSATDPLYLLYTSGTTGTPKAVVRPIGGHAVTLKWSMAAIYNMNPHEVWFTASDFGWVVGHSYICYAPLLNCNTTIIYEGKPVGTPNSGALFRVIQEHNAVSMFLAPTALRAIIKEDPECVDAKHYRHPQLRALFLAGEHCDSETLLWAREAFNTPVLDHWWQTETGSAITATCVGLGNNLYPDLGLAGKPVPGWNMKVLRDDMSEAEPNELGAIVAKLPLPPGNFSSLWKNEENFKNLYFTKYPGYYDTMDSGFMDEEGNLAVMARTDDVINVAGHRLSTGALEEAVSEHPDIVEAAVVGKADKLKGQLPVGLCVVKSGGVGHNRSHPVIIKEVIEHVRKVVGPVAAFKECIIVKRLPKTRSGKISRNTIAAMISGKPYNIPVTIEDPAVYAELIEAFLEAGYQPTKPQN